MEYKAFKFESVDGVSDEGVIEGVLSPYNNIDLGKDIVRPGAFTKTLSDQKNRVPALYQHDWHMPIGVSLGIIGGILATSVVMSLAIPERKPPDDNDITDDPGEHI